MLKVMIVDDEFYFREALKTSFPWKELGFEICGEAKNGKDALQSIERCDPDIVMVDINMPIMDGLEFIQSVREKRAASKFIILTGHSEFNYAKQAVQLGVNNYILKPVDDEELKTSLFEVKRSIEKEAGIKIEIDSLKNQVRESLPLLKEKFLSDLIQGISMHDKEEACKRMNYLNINVHSEYYQAVTIELDYHESLDWNDEDFQLWKFAVSNIVGEILGEQFDFDICYDRYDRICMIVGIKAPECQNSFTSLLENRLDLIRTVVDKHLDFTVTIGVGSQKSELFDISASYNESIVALRNKLTIGENRIIPYSTVVDTEIKGNLFTSEHRSQLLMNLRTEDDKEVQRLLEKMFFEMRRENIHHEILFVVCVELVAVCMEYILEAGLSITDILPISRLNIVEELLAKRSIDDMECWVKEIYEYTAETIKRSRSKKVSKLINEVKNYIMDNYQNHDLNIDEIAKKLFVNYAHLCFIFKRDTGITINEYLTEFRIKKAKELLDAGNNLILDVACKVGYADANYFGKCFKKFYGLAPSKYLENKS